MSEFRQRGSFETYHTQLKRINDQRRKNYDSSSSPSPPPQHQQYRRTQQIFSIEDIPFDGSFDQEVTKPQPPSPRNFETRSSTWSTNQSTPTTRNDYSQKSVQSVSVYDSWESSQQQTQTHDGWPNPPQRTAKTPPRTTHNNSPTTPPDQHTTPRVKMIQPDRFQQWQSEATQLWTCGIDISMEEKPGKKKAAWLTREEFQSYSTLSHNNGNGNDNNSGNINNNSSSNKTSRSQSSYSRPPPPQRPLSPPPPQHQHQPPPQSTPSGASTPTSSLSGSSEFVTKLMSNLQSLPGVLLFLDAVDTGMLSPQPLLTVLPNIIKHSLDNRCVDKLLTIMVRAPANVQPQLLQVIESHPNIFHHYIPSYICLPRDILLVLEFLLALFTHCPSTLSSSTSSSSSWSDLVKKLDDHYTNRLKTWFPLQTHHSINDRLQKVRDLQHNAVNQWGGWTITEELAEQKDNGAEQYLHDQLASHQQLMESIGMHATQLASSSSTSLLSNSGWMVFKNVQWYRKCTVISPVTPGPLHVYRTSYSGKFGLDRHLVGCMAILVSPHAPPLFGTTIDYVKFHHTSTSNNSNQYLMAVYHSGSPNTRHPYDLIVTTIPATTLLALTDWLHTATAADINTPLATRISLWHSTIQSEQQHRMTPGYIPDYLDRLSLDVSTIMAPNFHGCKANISENSWPVLQSKHRRLPPSQRPPLYTLSNSQITCLQYALSHSYASIGGPSGSGKTYTASKCLSLVHQAIQQNGLHRPILVLCDTVTDIKSLVSDAVAQDTTLILGTNEHVLDPATLQYGSREWKQYRYHSRELETCVARLDALHRHRHLVVDKRQSQHVVNLMPPSYRRELLEKDSNDRIWLGVDDDDDDDDLDYPTCTAFTALTESIGDETNLVMSPLMALSDYTQQQTWMRDHPVSVIPLSEGRDWPFALMDDGKRTGDRVRYALIKIWSQVSPDDIWKLSVEARQELYYDQILPAYDTALARVMEQIQAKQSQIQGSLHELRVAYWRRMCNFNRVVAMPLAFAMVHTSLVRAIEPLVVLMDINKQKVSGAMVAALALGPDTQHVMVFGGANIDSDIGGGQRQLEEQWRMSNDVWQVWQAAVEHRGSWLEALPKQESKPLKTGIKYSTYCVALENKDDNDIDSQEQQAMVIQWLAQFVCYLYQQNMDSRHLVVLLTSGETVTSLTQALSKQEQQAIFAKGMVDKVTVTSVASYQGKDVDTVVLGVVDGVMPTDAQLSMALSRAKSAMYVVGARTTLANHPIWLRVLNFMKNQGRCSNGIPFVCQNHPETETMIQHVDDFANVQNGGCNEFCRTIMDCGHTCEEKCHHRSHEWIKCQHQCEQSRGNKCMHPCTKLCFECTSGCPPCLEPVLINLPCGHYLQVPCQEQDSEHLCQETVTEDLFCGHTVTGTCGCLPLCTSLCLTLLECGHPCKQLCGTEHEHDRSICTFECPKTLICGHRCAKGCAKPNDHTDRCLQKCARRCSHGYKCAMPCWKVCVKCKGSCPYQCPHSQCTKKCSESCDRVPCNEPCPLLLSCSHPCRGLCSEPCSKCVICEPDIQCSITLQTFSDFSEDERAYTLPECGCSFTLDGLDQYFASRVKSGEHTAIKQWVCPSCQVPILTAGRYAEYIRAEFSLIDTIKKQQETDLQRLTDEERLHIVNAMNQESNNHVNDIVGGRWFVCKNRHPYFIGDCGGATELSSCPECNEPIGGTQHQVVETNRFYGDFDGSAQPAWPGQPGS